VAGPEAEIERECVRLARKAGGDLLKIKFPNRVGCPDRLLILPSTCSGCYRTSISMVEFKRSGVSASRHQKVVHADLRSLGVKVSVVDSVDSFEDLLDAET
jgi:hypothetical protein